MESPRLIMFDCDGTLADTHFIAVEAMRLAFNALNVHCPSRHEIMRTYGLCCPEAIKRLAPASDPQTQERLGAAYLDWHYTLRQQSNAQEALFMGVNRLLDSLVCQEHILLGLATGKSRQAVLRFLDRNGLDGIFSTIQTADEAPSKPHPAMLMKAMDAMGVEAGQTYMVGDTTADIIMAGHAGVAAIGVSWGHHSAVELHQAGAVAVVDDFSELGQILSAPTVIPLPVHTKIAAA